MFVFAFLILKDVLKYVFVTAAMLTYIDLGPGGEALGSLVGTFEDLLRGIDWTSLANTVGIEFDNFMRGITGTTTGGTP